MSVKVLLEEGRISFIFLLVAVVLFPISRVIYVIALWPWIFFLFLESFVNKWKFWSIASFKQIRLYFIPGLLLLMVISLLWTEDLKTGGNQIGRSLLMIIFPIVLGFNQSATGQKSRLRLILKFYVLGTLISLAILIIYALYFSISISDGAIVFNPDINSWENRFYYERFSFLIQPTYYAMMVLMGAAICLGEIKKNNLFSSSALLPAMFAILLIGSLFIISSRIIIIASFAVIAWFIFARLPSLRLKLLAMGSMIVLMIFLLGLHPRFDSLQAYLFKNDKEKMEQFLERAYRLKTWYAAVSLIKEHPLHGVGIGDVGNSLEKIYQREHLLEEEQQFLNCHNQFLETWLSVGILGFILLLVTLFYPILHDGTHPHLLYAAYVLIVFIVFLSESVLNRLWGVAFFTFFYLVLSSENQSERI